MIKFESYKIIINTDMYRGFQLDLAKDDFKDIATLECENSEIIKWCVFNELNRKMVKKAINECFLSDGSIDGSKMKENWFPQIQADIFISHSHQDKALACDLSKWMYLIFDLKVFIDSDIWGYYKDMKDKMLNYYRDFTTEKCDELEDFVSAHVHMMLSVALNQMIDNTECLFFLNTPNSLSINVPIVGTTPSPWIYSEIATSRLLRNRTPQRLDQTRSNSTESLHTRFRRAPISVCPPIRHAMSIDHLKEIDSKILREWKDQWIKRDRTCPCHPLDSLYLIS